jgi:uncharacterized protein (DUF885 family)
MKIFKGVTVVLFLIFMGCSKDSKVKDSGLLNEIILEIEERESYDEDEYPLGLFSKEHFKKEAEYAKEQLIRLHKIDVISLSETESISLELLKFQLQDAIDYFEFERYLNPLLSDSGFHTNFSFMVRPFQNYEQVKTYLTKLNAIPSRVNQFLPLLREGLEKGVSQPSVIFNGYESSYNDHIVENIKESYFYQPFNNLPKTLTSTQKDSVLIAAKEAITTNVIPQFKVVKTFFEEEYFPKTRTSIGISETPNGNVYYQNRINYYTTSTQYSADDIHSIGLKEVARIKTEMEKIISELNFQGSFSDFLNFLRTDPQFYATSPKQLLMIARDMAKRADEQLPRFFKTLPSRPLYVLPSLTVHEAVPGHHLQSSLNLELGDSIPQFRKDTYLSAYGEGWGLYCEFLAEEMGMYTTLYEQFGKLTYEMWRACRLVVDTGIHTKGWTREQVINYMAQNTALSIHEINTETDRYISWPGQALSYKIGEIKIRELRKKAEMELGSSFDIREFHEVVLEQGTVTLSILENRVNNYIEDHKNE